MLIQVLSIILFLIFTVLSGFHVYWLFGGTWGTQSVFPTKLNEATTIKIPKFATLIVALGLATMAYLYLIKSGLAVNHLPSWITRYAYWIIPCLFILRAIGEFNYVGLFKKVKETKFGKADTRIFSPLCLFIGIAGLLIQFV